MDQSDVQLVYLPVTAIAVKVPTGSLATDKLRLWDTGYRSSVVITKRRGIEVSTGKI
jgi:hypothetical protein